MADAIGGQPLALHMAAAKDMALRQILDTALGADGWALSMVPGHGHLLVRPDGTEEVWWDGRHLATIRMRQNTDWSRAGLKQGWQMSPEVEQHVKYL